MFKELSEWIGKDKSMTIQLSEYEGKMHVLVHLVSKKPVKAYPPIKICGTPEELDNHFIELIREPVTTAGIVFTNQQEFEKRMKATPAVKESSKTVGMLLLEAEKLLRENKQEEAYNLYKRVLDKDPRNAKAHEKIKTLSFEMRQTNLFTTGTPAEPPKEEEKRLPKPEVQPAPATTEPVDVPKQPEEKQPESKKEPESDQETKADVFKNLFKISF